MPKPLPRPLPRPPNMCCTRYSPPSRTPRNGEWRQGPYIACMCSQHQFRSAPLPSRSRSHHRFRSAPLPSSPPDRPRSPTIPSARPPHWMVLPILALPPGPHPPAPASSAGAPPPCLLFAGVGRRGLVVRPSIRPASTTKKNASAVSGALSLGPAAPPSSHSAVTP